MQRPKVSACRRSDASSSPSVPHESTKEIEDFKVELAHITVFELRIDPDRSHDPSLSQSFASLAELKLA